MDEEMVEEITDCRVLDEMEVKGREIFVKWRDDGVWICPDPTCQTRNFLVLLLTRSRLV